MNLTLKAQGQVVHAGTALLLLAAAATLAMGLVPPSTLVPHAKTAPSSSSATAPLVPQLDLSKLLVLCRIDLRKPMSDTPTAPIAAATPEPAPTFSGRLLATMVEPRNPQAMVQSGKHAKLVSVGDVIEGATLLEVSDGSAKFRIGGQTITVKVEERRSTPEKGRKTP